MSSRSLSTYCHTCQQFGLYNVNGPYGSILFRDCCLELLLSQVGSTPDQRCFSAAWMLTLLHDRDHGFRLETSQYGTWKGLLQFPTMAELVERSSGTMGAAALMAEHKGLVFCPRDDELAIARSYLTTPYGRELSVIVPPMVYLMSEIN